MAVWFAAGADAARARSSMRPPRPRMSVNSRLVLWDADLVGDRGEVDAERDAVAVANLKQQHFSYIDLTGIIGGIRRSIRLELDPEWIQRYVREQRAGE